ncbi:hypothetical protein MLPF_1241 [Mycobacterium lepromatosis]|uniref:hypothetical protein n=1 Tax=Mycobacterium lepromatosis TaxID=480418 RepID=UPI0005F77F1D|nr:hypothetical protein [Mycobacterium lepromatosis]UKN42092.1 hypothetical protein MLPF_1241 [Mycobacterium lepromatosis]
MLLIYRYFELFPSGVPEIPHPTIKSDRLAALLDPLLTNTTRPVASRMDVPDITWFALVF